MAATIIHVKQLFKVRILQRVHCDALGLVENADVPLEANMSTTQNFQSSIENESLAFCGREGSCDQPIKIRTDVALWKAFPLELRIN